MFTGERLYSSNGQTLFKVPVAYGTRLSEGSVPDTCEGAGMKAVCQGQAGCQFNSARCKVVSIETTCGNILNKLANLICDGNHPSKCPQLEGVFNYMNNWIGSEYGHVGGTSAVGNKFVSSSGTPLFAYCVHSI